MSPVAYKKRKERLALALRIESLNREALPCSYCRSHSRRCLMNRSESLRYSECVRSKRPCDSLGYKPPPKPRKVVCRFFHSPKRLVPERLVSVVPTSWFPAFELDAFLSSSSLGDPGFDLPSDPDDPFWATLDFDGGMPPAADG